MGDNIENTEKTDIYLRYCNLVENIGKDDPQKWNFKSNPDFTYMLEHTSYDLGIKFLEKILEYNLSEEDIKYIKLLITLNDSVGGSIKHFYNHINMKCSPSNLRYIYHSLCALNYAKSKNLKELDIIEIGGGYGGLSFYMINLANLFGIDIKTYTILDRKEPILMIKKYTGVLKKYLSAIKDMITVDVFNIDTDTNYKQFLKKNSFMISTSAYSEIPRAIQEKYTKEVINTYTSHGWISWNAIPIYDFVEKSHISYTTEEPLTGPPHLNKFVTFCPENKL